MTLPHKDHNIVNLELLIINSNTKKEYNIVDRWVKDQKNKIQNRRVKNKDNQEGQHSKSYKSYNQPFYSYNKDSNKFHQIKTKIKIKIHKLFEEVLPTDLIVRMIDKFQKIKEFSPKIIKLDQKINLIHQLINKINPKI